MISSYLKSYALSNGVWLYATLLLLFIFITHKVWNWWHKRLVKVNCWFCKENSFVKSLSVGWWFCYYCEQYNGFNKDGDYAEDIPNMYKEDVVNLSRYCERKTVESKSNLLCSPCSRQQRHKVEEISSFHPSHEDAFDVEYAHFKRYLDDKYNLCLSCRTTVAYRLQQQDAQIKGTHFSDISTPPMTSAVRKLTTDSLQMRNKIENLFLLEHVASFIAASWLLRKQVTNMETNVILMSCAVVFLLWLLAVRIYLKSTQRNTLLHSDILTILPAGSALFIYLLWIVASLYGIYSTSESRLLRFYSLTSVAALELVVGSHATYNFLLNTWTKMKYLQKRKRKIELARNSPKARKSQLGLDDPDISNNNVNTGDASCNHVVDDSSYAENLNDVSSCNESQVNVTPDLLHGHLDAMFIERMSRDKQSDGEVKNHVIAALKYATSSNASTASNEPRPLLRPAKFVWRANCVESRENVKRDNSTDGSSQSREQPLSEERPQICDESNPIHAETKTAKIPPSKTSWWKYIFYLVFICSVFINVYFLYMVKKK